MQSYPVFDQFWSIPALTPTFVLIFAVAFAASALATMRRCSYGVAILLFTLPFDLMHGLAGTTMSLPKVALLGVAVGLLARPNVWRALSSSAARHVILAFAIMVAACAVTIIPAQHRAEVVREVLKWFEYFAYFAVALAAYQYDPDDALVRWAFAISVVLVCATALAQEITGSPWGIYLGKGVAPRISGALEGPNQLAGYLGTAIAFLGAWSIARRSRFLDLALGLCALTLFLTFSRGGVIGAVAVVFVLALYARKTWSSAFAGLFAGMAAGINGVLIWTLYAVRPEGGRGPQTLKELLATPKAGAYSGGVGNRAELWHAAWQFWRAHPLLGIGAGNYELELAQVGLPGIRTHANSWYLQSLAEGGIIGLLAVFAFLYIVVRELIARAYFSPWALAALAATAGLAIHQLADYLVFYPKVAEPWIILIALGIASPQPQQRAS